MESLPGDTGTLVSVSLCYLVLALFVEHDLWYWCLACAESVVLSISLYDLHLSPWRVISILHTKACSTPNILWEHSSWRTRHVGLLLLCFLCESPSLGTAASSNASLCPVLLQTTKSLWKTGLLHICLEIPSRHEVFHPPWLSTRWLLLQDLVMRRLGYLCESLVLPSVVQCLYNSHYLVWTVEPVD